LNKILKFADSSVNSEDRGYSYDAAWNLNYRTSNGSLQTFNVDGKNQLTTTPDGACAYDANGNLTNAAGAVCLYDDENRLVEWRQASGPVAGALATTFVYDGLGRLRARGEFQGNGSYWGMLSVVNYLYDGRRVFKKQAVQLLHTCGRSLAEFARELGVPAWQLRDWKQRLQPQLAQQPETFDAMRVRLAELERDNLQLRQQRDILKKLWASSRPRKGVSERY